MKKSFLFIPLIAVMAATSVVVRAVFADTSDVASPVAVSDSKAAGTITDLNDQIAQKKAEVDKLNGSVATYKKKIADAEAQSATLVSEMELLDNRVAKTELDISATDEDISATNDEIQLLQIRADAIEHQLELDRASLGDILRKMDTYDNDMTLQLLFGSDSFGELFDRLQQLSSVTGDLKNALTRAEAERTSVINDRASQVGKRTRLADLQADQLRQKGQLDEEKEAKQFLLAQTQRTESAFQGFLSSIHAEQQSVSQEIGALQGEVERKLSTLDNTGQGSSVISWPLAPNKGLSTLYHDPTYPFRHLFEHPGIDIPTPLGTPVKSSAPGYVAWTKTGTQYGNYVMVIHADGIATLYAHLSKFAVKQDEYVGRGTVIGLSGGVPGMQGAGLSTGAHLHYEVRLNGIPVNPLNYLDHTPLE